MTLLEAALIQGEAVPKNFALGMAYLKTAGETSEKTAPNCKSIFVKHRELILTQTLRKLNWVEQIMDLTAQNVVYYFLFYKSIQ